MGALGHWTKNTKVASRLVRVQSTHSLTTPAPRSLHLFTRKPPRNVPPPPAGTTRYPAREGCSAWSWGVQDRAGSPLALLVPRLRGRGQRQRPRAVHLSMQQPLVGGRWGSFGPGTPRKDTRPPGGGRTQGQGRSARGRAQWPLPA
uniref:Uncharacterized protein n=1 Tax=Neovison vison TaxID=452646 RepID=A0A8C7C0E8_NEOVI